MLELGPDTTPLPRRARRARPRAGVELLITVGDLAAEAGAGNGGEPHAVAHGRPRPPTLLPGLLQPGDTVLVKGSRGVGLEVVAEALEAREA